MARVPFAVRRASIDQAAALAAFGARTFAEAFGTANTPEDMAAYLALAYGERQQRDELADPDIVTLVVEDGGEIVGFAQVRRGAAAPECVTTDGAVELWRLYVDRGWHGRGIAQALMAAALEAARELGGRAVWLGVWEHNPRAMAFYARCGFSDVGSKSFTVGDDRQTDRVYLRDLG